MRTPILKPKMIIEYVFLYPFYPSRSAFSRKWDAVFRASVWNTVILFYLQMVLFFFQKDFQCHPRSLVLLLKSPHNLELYQTLSSVSIILIIPVSISFFRFPRSFQVCFSCYWFSLFTTSALFAASDEGFNVASITFLILEVIICSVSKLDLTQSSPTHCLFLWFNHPLKVMKDVILETCLQTSCLWLADGISLKEVIDCLSMMHQNARQVLLSIISLSLCPSLPVHLSKLQAQYGCALNYSDTQQGQREWNSPHAVAASKISLTQMTSSFTGWVVSWVSDADWGIKRHRPQSHWSWQ